MRLSPKQREALEWLKSNGPWTTPWWGGKPHGGWPRQMPSNTCAALRRAGFVKKIAGSRLDKSIAITDAGKVAIFRIGAPNGQSEFHMKHDIENAT